MWFKQMTAIAAGILLSSNVVYALQSMDDDEMRQMQGQALLTLTYNAPSGVGSGANSSDYAFYKLGIDGTLALNANIKNLNLGCDGPNGTGLCDIKASEVSFGCVSNAANVCIPVSGTNTNTGVSSTEARTNMRDFVLTNPFLQFAIKNAGSASTREFVGLRLGADRSQGPISFGNLQTFSGYLNASLNLAAQGQTDVAVTCGDSTAPCRGPSLTFLEGGDGSNDFNLDGLQTLGLDDECALRALACTARFRQLTVNYNTATRVGAPILINGRRQTQASISNINFGKNTVNGRDGIVQQVIANLNVNRTSSVFGEDIINGLLPALKNSVADRIVNQLAAGLGTTAAALNNDTYVLPYNLSNFKEADIDSNLFGLSLQKSPVLYPGYVAAAPQGFGLYIPNAFTLELSKPTTELVSNIVGGQAALGNITNLQPANVNCFGTLTFC